MENNNMNQNGSSEKQKVLIFGLGQFARGLLRALSPHWQITVVDMHEARIAQSKEEVPEAEYIHGAADSMITWNKIDLTQMKYIISAVRSTDLDLEVCRIARDHFQLKIPVLVLVYNEVERELFEPFHVTVLNPMELGIQVVFKRMSMHVAHAANVGLGIGELIEVTIKARSHLVDRKLKYLHPKRWRISALYRNGELILPEGNCKLKIGDRVLLVGKPEALDNISETLLKGLPQFPLQYGEEILFPLHETYAAYLDEAIYWVKSFKARTFSLAPFKNKVPESAREKIETNVKQSNYGEPIERFKQIFPVHEKTGITVIPVEEGWFSGSNLQMAFKKSKKPFLLSRKQYPYDGVIIQLNGPDPGQAMETGVEIGRLLGVPYRVVYVTLPKEMRGNKEDAWLRLRQQIIADYEAIYRIDIPYDVLEGNPVLETLKFINPYKKSLMVIMTDPKASLAFHKQNAPYMIAKKTDLSCLVIPETHNIEPGEK